MSDIEYVIVGRVRRAHGIKGELVVEPLTDEPDAVFASGRRIFAGTVDGDPALRSGRKAQAAEPLTVSSARPFNGGLLVVIDGLSDRNEADQWRERYLLAPADELTPPAENEVYLDDLIGMHAVGDSGDALGDVINFFELPQGIVLEVKLALARGAQKEVLLPFTDEVVTDIDSNTRVITVNLPDGLLD